MRLPERDQEKKTLANLSNEELAELSPEELEQAKRAKENLLGIKKVDREVKEMDNQEQWAAQVQATAQKHGIGLDEAEVLLKHRMGIERPSDVSSWMQFMQPKPSLIEQAFSEAIAARMEQIIGAMFSPGGNSPGAQAQPSGENPVVGMLERAKAAGVQSLYMPDGTVLNLQGAKDNGEGIGATIERQVAQYVDGQIQQILPKVLNPGNNSGVDLQSLGGNAEIAKLYYEDKWKGEQRAADQATAQAKIDAAKEIAAGFGAAFSPGGLENLRKLFKLGPSGAGAEQEGAGQSSQGQKVRTLRTTCWNCMRAFPYEEGQAPVCPYCGRAQKAKCQSCGEEFKITNRDHIVCPKCGAEYSSAPSAEQQESQEPGDQQEQEQEQQRPRTYQADGLAI